MSTIKSIYSENILNKYNKSKYIKDYFVIDIDDPSVINLLYVYSKIFALFLKNETDYKNELKTNDLVRVYLSSSKSGYHLKVNVKNSLLENFCYRAILNDDIYRLWNDIKRLKRNDEGFVYDVCFSCKVKFNKLNKKDFKVIDVLSLCNLKKSTFYKLVNYIKLGKSYNINLILSHVKKNLKHSHSYISLFGDLKLNQYNLEYNDLKNLINILLRFSNNPSDFRLDNYTTNKPLGLVFSVYNYFVKKEFGKNVKFKYNNKDLELKKIIKDLNLKDFTD